MSEPFKPVGERPRWQLFYDELMKLGVGDVITYDQLKTIGGIDVREQRSAFYKAMQKLQREHKRQLDNVRGVGYRVVEAKEHETLSGRNVRSSRRQMTRAVARLRDTRRTELPDDGTRERFRDNEIVLGRHENALRRLARRQQRFERLFDEHVEEHVQTSAHLLGAAEEMQDRQDRLEAAMRRAHIHIPEPGEVIEGEVVPEVAPEAVSEETPAS